VPVQSGRDCMSESKDKSRAEVSAMEIFFHQLGTKRSYMPPTVKL
jgi:hypothetical protein